MLAPDVDLRPDIFARRCLPMGAALSLNNMFFYLKHGGKWSDRALRQCMIADGENIKSWTGRETLIKLLREHKGQQEKTEENEKCDVVDGSRVAQLPLAGKKLESLGEAWLRAVPLSQRRHDLHATAVKRPSHGS